MRKLKSLTKVQAVILLVVLVVCGLGAAYSDFDNPEVPVTSMVLVLVYFGASVSIWQTMVLINNAVTRRSAAKK